MVRAIREASPAEDIVYLGDTARVPYGTRSPGTVIRYARSCASHLQTHGIKHLVVACNTVSAVALDMLRVELDIPVLGVIEPGARAGVRASERSRVGVIATAGTILSGAYERAILAEESRAEVCAQAAPLLVPLVEEGWVDGEVPRLAIRRYLEPLVERGVDVLILGCTHYPILGESIRRELDEMSAAQIQVVDSAAATAAELARALRERDLGADSRRQGALRLLVTDMPGAFREVASRFLGTDVKELDVEGVDL